MNNHALRTTVKLACGVLAVSTVAVSAGGVRLMTGVLVGGVWNLASLWCLAQCLDAWLGPEPSTRRAVAWLLMKFPLLYGLVIGILRHPSVSLLGFGIGFTAVLLAAVGGSLLCLQRLTPVRSHGH